VFVGKVVAIDTQSPQPGPERGYLQRRIRLEVLERFQGALEGNVTLLTGLGGGDCGYPFQVDGIYVVYAHEDRANSPILGTGICTRTAPVERAKEDLAFLRSLASKGPEGRIFGYVARKRPNRWEEYSGEGAIPGVSVRLESDEGQLTAVTNSRGEYEFSTLRPGRYRLWAEIPGKLGGGEAREVNLPRQACLSNPFFAIELGSIAGVLRNANGEPIVNEWVELLRASDREPAGIESGFTDEEGRFVIARVPEGAYLVGIHLRETPHGTRFLSKPYERNYYPGVRDPEMAQVVNVQAAQAVSAVNWKAGLPLRQRAIRGALVGPDGKPATEGFVELKVEGYERNADLARPGPDGSFRLEGLEGLRHFVQASSGWREGSEAWHCHRVSVPSGEEPIVIKLDRPGKDCDECRKKK